MTQLTGSVAVEVDLNKLADMLALRLVSQLATDQLADRVAFKVAALLTAGDAYERDDPNPAGTPPPRGTLRTNLDTDPTAGTGRHGDETG